MANPEAHYATTGPNLGADRRRARRDRDLRRTGGTISGVGRYFKSAHRGAHRGVDPEDRYTAGDQSDLHPYFVEGIGKDTWPATMMPRWSTSGCAFRPRLVPDGARLAREEAYWRRLFGTTVWAALQVAGRLGPDAQVLAMLPTPGARTLQVPRRQVDARARLPRALGTHSTVGQLLRSKRAEESDVPALVTISSHQKVGEAIDVMQRYSISQLPVVATASSERWPT